jgi:RimJ/RimL family protein N-acetyltransferase
MMRILIFIKHHLSFIWSIAEWCNGIVFSMLYKNKILDTAERVCKEYSRNDYVFCCTERADISNLSAFFYQQPDESYRYFKPHAFDEKSLLKLWNNASFFQFIVKTPENRIAGYFLIRFFVNRKAFVGFLVGNSFQGHGIAKQMCRIALNICWENGFRTFATVSKDNTRALAAYRRINDFTVLKELSDNYIYIEYTQNGMKGEDIKCITA